MYQKINLHGKGIKKEKFAKAIRNVHRAITKRGWSDVCSSKRKSRTPFDAKTTSNRSERRKQTSRHHIVRIVYMCVCMWYRPRRCVKNANYYWSKRTSAACARKRKRRQQLRWRWETLSSTFASIRLTSFVISMKAERQQTTIENQDHHCSWSLSCFRNCVLRCP